MVTADFGGPLGCRRPLRDDSVVETFLVHAANTSLHLNGRGEVLRGWRLICDWSATVVRWFSVVGVRFRWSLVVTDH